MAFTTLSGWRGILLPPRRSVALNSPAFSRPPGSRRIRPPGVTLALILAASAPAVVAQAPEQGLGLVETVQLALEHDPNLSLEAARLRSSRGFLLATRGAFDPIFNTSVAETETDVPLSETTSREQSVLSNSFGVTKRFRSGLSIEPELELLRTEDPAASPANLGTFSFTVRQPLLRGRGRSVVAAPERSAERQVAASELDLRQTTSERVLVVVEQYWVARAALLDLEILRETEDRARELLDTTRRLIEADVIPAADLVQVEANLVSKETARIGGERDLFEARQALGREIGLERGPIASLPYPRDPFPTVPAAAVPSPSEGERFVAAALERRSDLRAAGERQEAAEILRRAGENGLKPQIDLIFIPSYSGLVEGTDAGSFFSPLYRNVPGVNSSVLLSVSWPTLNSQARGELVQLESAREQNALFAELLTRQIGADVPSSLDAVARNAQQLERAVEAVRLFERAVDNEEKKLRAGTSTLLDVITQRDRLTSARQAQVSAHLALAVSLARLRFETGTLLPDGEDAREVSFEQLTTVPLADGRMAP
ncbi:MAG TPA: TolC family protein [Thermoanaerobaculia bacterium]|nr:TolC family protein [Thermoanaerobaculia bacterium]